MRGFYSLLTVLSIILSMLLPLAVQAQTADPTPESGNEETTIPQIHTVAEGENLTYLAGLYGVTVNELLLVNNLADDDILFIGQQLIIPGREGETITTTYVVQVGDSLAEVAAIFNTSVEEIVHTNRLINLGQALIPGEVLVINSRNGSTQPQPMQGSPHVVNLGESLLMVAARYGLSPTELAFVNDLSFPAYLYPGQRLRVPGAGVYRHLPGSWVDIQVQPLPVSQGSAFSIYVENLWDSRPTGQWAGQPLYFAPQGNGFSALVGVDAFTQPGTYLLELGGSGNQPWPQFWQEIPVHSSNYETQFLTVGEELAILLDPEIRAEEDAFFASVYGRFDDSQQWDGLFQLPLTRTIVTTPYGVGRSYNGGPIDIYHTGIDLAEVEGTLVYAPASGIVVFSGQLLLRGTTLIIDHGRGVMTGYYHLAETFVEEGDVVTPGQPIASVGSTGLSTGPHLHWDVRVMNVPVDGFQWTTTVFP